MNDIVEWGHRLQRFTRDVPYEQSVADEVLQLACIECIEVVGEAAGVILRNHSSFAEAHRALPLAEAYRTRNRLSHGYDLVDHRIIWLIVTRDVPGLVEQAESLSASRE
ncbi:MAG TPA: HepT-like ribonuclease domain-containing protein [Mesorhizobium sp.]|nr:HepT-like ribonuclease domain-containing protein [Mesorhizobium sp.]